MTMPTKIFKRLPKVCCWSVTLPGILTAVFLASAAKPVPQTTSGVFTDVTLNSGISWKHFNGESPDAHLIETKNGGAAFLDFDQDGLLDIFLVNGGETPRGKSPAPVRNALYHNLGSGKFEDTAAKAGIDHIRFYGIAVAVGDYDNDGYPDILITGYPERALFHNNRDGTFSEITEKAGLRGAGRWSTGAAWFDYDRDGWLDLMICHYSPMSFDSSPHCEFQGKPAYCAPRSYGEGEKLALYRNNGNGTFTDTSASAGVDKSIGRGLAAVAVDVDGDGWIDVFVARDGSPNLLLINQHDGTFRDFAMQAEVAYDPNGNTKAGMGIDAADVNGDGRPDFVMTTFNNEQHSLFINSGKFPFEDWTIPSSLGFLTMPYVGWGAHFLDYDNDGVMDLLIVNGHVNKSVEQMSSNVTYKELALLLRNDGKGNFRNVQESAGPAFQKRYDARGLAVGDYDNDGDIDVAIVRLQDTPILLRNNAGEKNQWVGVQLVGTQSNRDAIGAKLTLAVGDRKLVRWITGGASIFSSHDHRVVFGLGVDPVPSTISVEIQWPNGVVQKVDGLAPNRYHKVVESSAGRP